MSDRSGKANNDITQTSTGKTHLLAEGRLLAGRYCIADVLGLGGMGMVYRAHDKTLGVDVALKVLRDDRNSEPGERSLDRFQQELVLARQVSHRNVVRIHDIGNDGDIYFLTMDIVEGRSLKEIIQERGQLPIALALDLARQLALGLNAAHETGVIHRDLKPANILVDADNTPYITDFGVARSAKSSALTRTGHIVGTPDYLSPEQARGGDLDGRSDIYALGLILYEMLSGQLPFSGETYQEILAQRAVGKPRKLSDLGVRVPDSVERIIEHCLARNPADRYDNALQLAEDLGDGQGTKVMLKRRRRQARGALIISLVTLAAAAVGFAGYRLIRSDDAATPASAAVSAARSASAIAILPFENATGRTDLDWLRTGIPELVTDQLDDNPDLQLVEANRVLQTLSDLKMIDRPGSPADIRQAAELLGTKLVVTGSIRAAGPAIRLDARVVSIGGAQTADRTFSVSAQGDDEIFLLVNNFALALKETLAVPADTIAPDAELSESAPALRAYTEGVRQLYLGNSVEAAPLLEAAVEDDADFAAAWLRLSEAYEMLGFGEKSLQAIQNASSLLADKSTKVALETRAREATLSGDIERAQTALATIVERYPADSEARVALALAYENEGQLDKAMSTLREVLASDQNHPRAWFLMGKYAILTGDTQSAIDEYLVRALVIQNRLGNQQGRADTLNAMGIAYHRLGQLDRALENYQQAAEIRARIEDQRGVASSRSNIARILVAKGEIDKARGEFEQAMQSRESIGDRAGVAVLHNEIGLLEESRGRYADALSRFRLALQIRRQLGDKRALTESYSNVGFAYFSLGEYDNASVYWRQALDTAQELGNLEDAILARQNLGLLAFARGQWEAALKEFLETLDEARKLGSPVIQAVSHGNLGRLAMYQGRFDAAQRSLNDAIEILASIGDSRGETEYRLFMTELLNSLGQDEERSAQLKKISTLLENSGNREQLATLYRLRAEQALHEGELQQAADELAQALQYANDSGNPVVILRTKLAGLYADFLAGRDVGSLAGEMVVDAETSGNVPLQLHALEIATQILLARDDYSQSEQFARRWQRQIRAVGIYEGAWRADMALASSLIKQGKAGLAAPMMANAKVELTRLRQNMNDLQWQSFSKLPGVKELTDAK